MNILLNDEARRIPVLCKGQVLWTGLDADRPLRSGCRRPAGGGSFSRDNVRLIFVRFALDLVICEEFGRGLRFAGRRVADGIGIR
jgi:hypothetical protein